MAGCKGGDGAAARRASAAVVAGGSRQEDVPQGRIATGQQRAKASSGAVPLERPMVSMNCMRSSISGGETGSDARYDAVASHRFYSRLTTVVGQERNATSRKGS